MKNLKLLLVISLMVVVTSCYEDLGNYDYNPPEDPVVYGLTGKTFIAFIGDSLRIEPEIQHSLVGTDQLEYTWEIAISTELRSDFFYGPKLKMLFGYEPYMYFGRLTILNKSNGMKYFYEFRIDARTEFSRGVMVLSNQGGKSKLSFIKPGDILKTDLYEIVNKQELPANPLQLELVSYPQPGFDTYWIVTGEVNKPGVIINPDHLKLKSTIYSKFFDAPENLTAEYLWGDFLGTTTAVYNGKLYKGTMTTAPYNSSYGSYGNPVAGDYQLAPGFISQFGQYTVAYEKEKKQFVMFSGQPAYNGTNYTVVPTGLGFNPTDVGLDLVHMMFLNSDASYAFFKDESGDYYEYKFSNVPGMFFANYKRPFAGSEFVNEDTKWEGSYLEKIYFTSDDKVYYFNPLNEEVKLLDTTFDGNKITMIHLTTDGNTLLVGTDGKLTYLDVGTGKNGNTIKTVSGIPGSPVDVVIRTN